MELQWLIIVPPEGVAVFLNKQDFQLTMSGFSSCGFNIDLLTKLSKTFISVQLKVLLKQEEQTTQCILRLHKEKFQRGCMWSARYLGAKSEGQHLLQDSVFLGRHLNSIEFTHCTLMTPRDAESFKSWPSGTYHTPWLWGNRHATCP